MHIPETLLTAIREKRAILFAGAGLSCNLGLPLFDVLACHLGQQLGLKNWREFRYPALAEYYLLETGRCEELFRWMKQTWHPDNIDIRTSEAHNYIVDLDFPIIYTTNYDSWIESAYKAQGKAFNKVIGVSDLAETASEETEIIKFHGDFDDPNSIVLTESSFLRRMSLDQPLDIRLRSDSLARPLLFVGYSMSDPNIQYLLFELRQLWAENSEEAKMPKSYLLMLERNEVQERLLQNRGVETIVSEQGNPSERLTRFFKTLCESVSTATRRPRVVAR